MTLETGAIFVDKNMFWEGSITTIALVTLHLAQFKAFSLEIIYL